ncbi:hypothetical protein AP064_05640 [Candidatus Liberibacter solanacearum]|uniref:Rha family transcriptional regulator n=1 Tax=Candidatus Liberibacter solanacearum TaxID=556287 RepID=UPI0006DC6276|nr:Rha family transcriptional regulator [Candidatus Liberibacter solanacearum]KQC48662.1 hypothetical protein AP064_05640 [Candidatus Liberibacter solanacearum]
MNDLENTNKVKTMSSREIAKLTGKRHDHVIRDIDVMFEKLEVSHPKFGASDFKGTYTKRGKIYPCYHLPKRESLILVSGYDVNLRARIIDRWAELEFEKRQQVKAQKPVSPNSYIKVHQFIEQTLVKAGLKDNQLMLATNRGVAKLTGFDLLSSAEIKHLPSPDNDEYVTPTVIGEMLDPVIKPKPLNRWLTDLGLQIPKHTKKGFIPTPKGEECGGKMCDVPMQHVEGSTQSLKWNPSILVPYLRELLDNNQSERH